MNHIINTGIILKDEENILWEIILTKGKWFIMGFEIPTGKVDIHNIKDMNYYGMVVDGCVEKVIEGRMHMREWQYEEIEKSFEKYCNKEE